MTGNREGASWQDQPTEGTGHAWRLWVHFDADVFDALEMPAVTYAQPGGLDRGQLEALLRPPALLSSARRPPDSRDFEPDNDPDGHNARRIDDLFAGLLER